MYSVKKYTNIIETWLTWLFKTTVKVVKCACKSMGARDLLPPALCVTETVTAWTKGSTGV